MPLKYDNYETRLRSPVGSPHEDTRKALLLPRGKEGRGCCLWPRDPSLGNVSGSSLKWGVASWKGVFTRKPFVHKAKPMFYNLRRANY